MKTRATHQNMIVRGQALTFDAAVLHVLVDRNTVMMILCEYNLF